MSTDLRWAHTEGGAYKSECGRYTIRRTRPRRWSARCWRQTATGSAGREEPLPLGRSPCSRIRGALRRTGGDRMSRQAPNGGRMNVRIRRARRHRRVYTRRTIGGPNG